ncbi:outer membrane beta-barrel family protein [Psychroflexus tropicus]|uniref:outer membrane beta-barrel family protein n=1 Tax=Psychroflexus tropicus TaxID=197345 RepID=UPI0003A0C2BC|nr:outer membrane beta-barrel family protein [Psychroflexus tropicus]
MDVSVTDSYGNNINSVIITTRELSDSSRIKEFFELENGKGKIKLADTYQNIVIKFKSYGYFDTSKIIQTIETDTIYSLQVILEEKPPVKLDDIIVVAKKKPFRIVKDTVSFNVSEYLDGSEQKVQDVIKKLPGVEVNEQSGEIKYKGKSIETVTLDGDNLFGFNYTLGTKNINLDIVDQVEAIDNYAENPLLKGIEQGGKVSLNLKLKKGKLDVSGNLDISTGWFDNDELALNLGSNILGITKTYKSFATLSYNNVGVNQTPFDYFGFSFNVEQQKEQNYFAEKIIPETRFSNLLEDRRANINNQFFGNYNAIFKISPKLNVKTNLYYLQDRITTNQLFQNDFQINNDIFTTTDNTFITKKPQQYRGDLEIKYNTSKTSLLEYNLRLRQENIETPTTIIQNQTNEFNTFLNTEDFYFKQDLLWTKKLSDKKALQLSLFHSFNDLPQTFSITPSLFDEDALMDTQESEFKRTFLEGKATYLGSGKRDKYTFTLGSNFNYSPFLSRLFNSEENISENNFDYTQSNIFNTGVYNFNRGKWQISPSYSVRVLNQNLEQNIINEELNQDDFIFEPALNLKYKLNSVSFLSGNLGYNQNTNAEQFFFLNQVLINNRTSISNLPRLELQNSQRYSLLYFNNDLYNQFQLNTNVSYQKSTGNFFTNQSITETTTQIEYFFLPQDNSNWNMNMQISKYIPFTESTLKLTSNYSLSNFRNIVNNSDLRQNQNQFLSNSFFWKTAFEMPVNFENTFTYQYSESKSENQSAFINKSWQNTFKVIFKPSKKWFFIISSDYYLPNTEQSDEQFFFLDATIRHRPKSKKWGASFTMRNITNENNFEQVQTSDISTTIFRSNLLPRYFLLNLTWNF